MKIRKEFMGLVALVSFLLSVNMFSEEPLSFEERVKAQEALERVYYSKRIWPKENPQPKPAFEDIMDEELIEQKVSYYLVESAALGQFWQRPITEVQLQAELDRIASASKDPKTLDQLFSALNYDPNLIAECLARPILADRLCRNWYANDERFHAETRRRAEEALNILTPTNFCQLPNSDYFKVIYKLQSDGEYLEQYPDVMRNERLLPQDEFLGEFVEAPEEGKISKIMETKEAFVIKHTLYKSQVEIEIESLVFKKESMENWLADQDIEPYSEELPSSYEDYYLPSITEAGCTEYWVPTSVGAIGPSARMDQASVWTGTEMIIWGGWSGTAALNTGGRYTPATDNWVATSIGSNVPIGRDYPKAVWTGTEMIVWGGHTSSYLNSGGRYNPLTDSWTATSTGTNVPEVRTYHVAVWTGTEMIVWGGINGSPGNYNFLNTGGRYNPSTNSWLPTSMGENVPTGRYFPSAVWTGAEMIVWGGGNTPYLWNTGGRYNPVTDSWIPTSTGTNVPQGRRNHTAIWTGSEMIIWGGTIESQFFNSGGRYNPSTDTWVATSSGANCPTAREFNTAIWTGTKMLIWGGWNRNIYFNDGGIYSPSSNSWTAISTGANVPTVRNGHTAEWTGSEMIVWGGYNSSGVLNSGGRYNPNTNTWVPTSTTSHSPEARNTHTAIWTGNEMIIWGGQDSAAYFNSGARYNPAVDSWTFTSVGGNTPIARGGHTAFWTGSEMIVWGGANTNSYLNSGGKYNPLTDSWIATSTGINLPSGRQFFGAVWTGTEMIVWGGINGSPGNYNFLNTGGRYNPTTNTWRTTSTGTNSPSGRYFPSAVWTGTEMIVWGGGATPTYFNNGGRYNPVSDTWAGVSTVNAPSPRRLHSAIWTGSEMILWGGTIDSYDYNNGGRYNPSVDSWIATSTGSSCPSTRFAASSLWTGTEMIVWGGEANQLGSPYFLNTGGRYTPIADSWKTVSTGTHVPAERAWHSAIWTGTDMIIWGGINSSNTLNNGGIYNLGASISLSPSVLIDGSVGSNYSQTITASGGKPPYIFSITAGHPPNGLALSSEGFLSGIPTQAGTFNFTVLVKDVNGCSATKAYSIEIVAGCPVVTVSPLYIPNGMVGIAYAQQVSASGGTTPYTFSVTEGTLPPGIFLDTASGMLSGLPSVQGNYPFSIYASDAFSCSGSQNYTLQIDPSVESPVISFIQKLGNPFRLKVLGSNFHPDIKVYIGGDSNPWTNIKYKNQSTIILKGGTALKNLFPKGVPVEIKVVNGDGGTAIYTYTRY